jgi:hypothetical protein
VTRDAFLDDDDADAHDHGERTPASTRQDELIGTSGSHTPARDLHGEEPYGEIPPSADTEGEVP